MHLFTNFIFKLIHSLLLCMGAHPCATAVRQRSDDRSVESTVFFQTQVDGFEGQELYPLSHLASSTLPYLLSHPLAFLAHILK